MELKGIDVSKYQGDINWKMVASSGVKFAFVRAAWAGYEGQLVEGKDSKFDQNMAGAIASGIPVGVYVYSYCRSVSAAQEAARELITWLKKYHVSYPIAFDIEDSKTYAPLGKTVSTQIAKAFLDVIAASGYVPILYTYTVFANSYLNLTELSSYDLWLADYRGYMGISGAEIWQYSSSGSVPGINGRVDMNIAYKDYNVVGGGKDDMLFFSVFGEKNCQIFNTKDVNNVAGKLLSGINYPVVADLGETGGFHWFSVYASGNIYYTVLLDDRSRLIPAASFTADQIVQTIKDQTPVVVDTTALNQVTKERDKYLAAINAAVNDLKV